MKNNLSNVDLYIDEIFFYLGNIRILIIYIEIYIDVRNFVYHVYKFLYIYKNENWYDSSSYYLMWELETI